MPEDAEDITDEFLDRFGDLPKSVERLIHVALMKALAERVGISKVESKGADLIFHTGRPDLSVWSEVFAKYGGMRIAPSGDRVIYRYTGTDVVKTGAKILELYYRTRQENLNNGEKNEG